MLSARVGHGPEEAESGTIDVKPGDPRPSTSLSHPLSHFPATIEPRPGDAHRSLA